MDFNDFTPEDQKEDIPPPEKAAYAAIMRSHLLDEHIIILKDKNMMASVKAEFLGHVIYTPYELEALEKLKGDPDAIRAVHHAKKLFDGKIY